MRTLTDDAVAMLEQALCHRIGQPRFQLWFMGKTRFSWQDGQLTVGVPNLMYQEYLSKTYADALRQTALETFGMPAALRFQIDPELFQKARQKQEQVVSAAQPGAGAAPNAAPHAAPHAAPEPEAAPAAQPLRQRERRWRRLEDFVAGSCNRLAHAAAVNLVEEPRQCPNPLVLHGPVGTGKTHLLEGICAGLRQRQPSGRILFLTAEEFTNRFLGAMHHGKLSGFRQQLRQLDALIVDDVNFLARKNATQEEFLHTFDALASVHAPLVLSCDAHPRLLDRLMPELADRLLGGAVCGLLPPDAATRRHILSAKTVAQGRDAVPSDVLDLLAEQLRGNVRELEGALHGLLHLSRATGRAVDGALAREALADSLRHCVRQLSLADIERAVNQALQLEAGALKDQRRGWQFSHPRMLAVYLARKHTGATYGEIGDRFGGRSHSTALAAEKKVRQLLAENGQLHLGSRKLPVRDAVERVESELKR